MSVQYSRKMKNFNPIEEYEDFVCIGQLSNREALSLLAEQIDCAIPERYQDGITISLGDQINNPHYVWRYKPTLATIKSLK